MRGLSSETRLRLALGLGAFAVAFGLSAARMGHGAPDFYVFWTAARHASAPYDPAIVTALEARLHLGGTWPFVYPPTFLLFVAPFALAPLTLAYPLWTGVSVGLFVLAASHLVRPVWAAAVLAVAPPVFFSAALGQTSLLIGAAAVAAWLWRDSRPLLAGALLGAAACIKPQAMLLAPVVFWGRWRMLGAMLAASAALSLASVLTFGAERWIEWAKAADAFRA
ncbi:MAG: glycosyltransferase family 87 protein, partial [Caulobacteraceae bacterium]